MTFLKFVLCASLLAASAATAQSSPGDVVVNVPFAFQVAGKALPAGHYIVAPKGDVIAILNSERRAIYVPVHSATRTVDDETKVIFHRYADTYFLSAIWVQGNTFGRELFPSRAERELKTRKAEMELAVIHPASVVQDKDKPRSDK